MSSYNRNELVRGARAARVSSRQHGERHSFHADRLTDHGRARYVMDDKQREEFRLDYGHADPYFSKPSAGQGCALFGFGFAVIPVCIIGANIADLLTVVVANEIGYRPPRSYNYWAIAFFVLLIVFGVVGILRFRKSPPPIRYFLLGFTAGLTVMGLAEGLCFSMR